MNKQQNHYGRPKALSLAIIMACMGVGNNAWATQPCTYDNQVNCFVANTEAKSAEVNGNFKRLWDLIQTQKSRIDDQQQLITTLTQKINTLEANVSTLNTNVETVNNNVTNLTTVIGATDNDGLRKIAKANKLKLRPVTYDFSEQNWKITGVNVQIVNGSGTTDGNPDGTGNLIIGYNEVRDYNTISICTKPQYNNKVDCESHGGVWGRDFRTGSHNLIVGTQNNYISYGGIVAGMENNIFSAYATVSGGRWNTASGKYSSVSGGYDNTASNRYSSVSGGEENTASGEYSSILGGYYNTASGERSTVSGGWWNTASGDFASVSGGGQNTASGEYSSVSGGAVNNAIGRTSSVSGGYENKAKGNNSSITGGQTNTVEGNASVILGESNKTETREKRVHAITNNP